MDRLSTVGGEVSVLDTVIVRVRFVVRVSRGMDFCHATKNSRKIGSFIIVHSQVEQMIVHLQMKRRRERMYRINKLYVAVPLT